MWPVQVFYSRQEAGHVRRAILSAPFFKSVFFDGEEHRIVDYMDIKVSADGTAYDMQGNRLPHYDLKLNSNEQYIVPDIIQAELGADF